MKRRNFFIFCVLLMALSLGLTSFAQDGKPRHGGREGMHHPHNPMDFALRELNLTSEQKTKVEAILTSQRTVTKELFEKNFVNHQKLHELIKSGNFDLVQVRAIAQSQATNQVLLLVEKQRADSQIYGVLTAEQQAKFDQFQNRDHRPMPPMPPMPPGEDRFVDMLSKRLALTSDQQTQLESILARQKEAVSPIVEKLAGFHKQLETITAKGHFDETQITNLAQEYLPLMVDLTVAHTTTQFNISSLLTAEQKEIFLRFPPLGGPGRRGPGGGPGAGSEGARPPRF